MLEWLGLLTSAACAASVMLLLLVLRDRRRAKGIETIADLAARYLGASRAAAGAEGRDPDLAELHRLAAEVRRRFNEVPQTHNRQVLWSLQVLTLSVVDAAQAWIGRASRLALLVIPLKHRDELAGDFREAMAEAHAQAFGAVARGALVVMKFVLYGWIALRLRIGDLVPGQRRETR